MDISKMKNIIVLKNVSSNIVEEAIVVLKENKKVSVCKYADDNKNNDNSDNFIINQAESIVNNFVKKIEKKQGPTKKDYLNLKNKYLKLKKINIVLAGMLLISLLLSF